MRKYFPLLVVIAVCIGMAVAQKKAWEAKSGEGTVGTNFIVSGTTGSLWLTGPDYETPSAERNVLMIVRVQEPCYQCVTTATWTASTSASLPTISAEHSYWFKTLADALAQAEKENWEVTYLAITRSVPYKIELAEERVKQPDVVTTKKHYKLEK